MKFSIATATIVGLDMEPHGLRNLFEWDIRFLRKATEFNPIIFENLGESFEDAQRYCEPIKAKFKEIGIEPLSKVVVLFETETLNVCAIGTSGGEKWIDVQDGFNLKTFEELKIDITSLIVY